MNLATVTTGQKIFFPPKMKKASQTKLDKDWAFNKKSEFFRQKKVYKFPQGRHEEENPPAAFKRQ